MNNKKFWALLTAVFLVVTSAAWAAQTKAPPKAAKEPTKAAPPKAKSEAMEKPKEHQATGTVVSFTDTSLVISKGTGKGKSEWTFVRNGKTTTRGTLAKDAKVTVYYHEEKDQRIAHRIKVWAPAAAEKPPAKSGSQPAKSKAAKTKS